MEAYGKRNWPDDDAPDHDVRRGAARSRRSGGCGSALGLSSFGDWLGLLATTALAGTLASGSLRGRELRDRRRLHPAARAGGAVRPARRGGRRPAGPPLDARLGDVAAVRAVPAPIPLVGTLWWLYVATVLIESVGLFWMPGQGRDGARTWCRASGSRRPTSSAWSRPTARRRSPPLVFAGLALLDRHRSTTSSPGCIGDPIDLALYVNAADVPGLRPGHLAARHPARPRPAPPARSSVLAHVGRRAGGTSAGRRSCAGWSLGMLGAFARRRLRDRPGPHLRHRPRRRRPGLRHAVRRRLPRPGRSACGSARGCCAGFSRRRLFGLSHRCAGGWLVLLALVPNMVVGGALHHRARRLRRASPGSPATPCSASRSATRSAAGRSRSCSRWCGSSWCWSWRSGPLLAAR